MLGGREKWSFSVFCHIGGPESGPGSLNWWSSRLQARWQHCRAAYLARYIDSRYARSRFLQFRAIS